MIYQKQRKHNPVALRKESVDRNTTVHNTEIDKLKSLSARRAWIEIVCMKEVLPWALSLSARRAWIEIATLYNVLKLFSVALRKESVDRNLFYGSDLTYSDGVALRKESVDRNTSIDNLTQGVFNVALRKESVDRNVFLTLTVRNVPMSLSARRAWIEIPRMTAFCPSVPSLSARRAWIEMRVVALAARPVLGSLSARRAWIEMSFSVSNGVAVSSRSPQGERG